MVFGVVSLNSGYLDSLGWRHQPLALETPLALPRAHLLITSDTVEIYRTLVSVVGEHLAEGRLVALPDCPEVYFLTGRFNLSGKMYDSSIRAAATNMRHSSGSSGGLPACS